MNFYERVILPRIVNAAMSTPHLGVEREKTLAGVHGDVLEIGFGSGLNLPFYPDRVRRLVGIDPSATGWKLARERVAASRFPVEHLLQSGETVPADADSFDTVVSTFTLCTIPDVERALSEVVRVLKRGGSLHFVEHGQSDDPRVRRWQDWWNPMHGRIFGGCQVNRPIERLVRGAGLRVERIETFYGRGPRALAYFYRGVATKDG